MCAYGALIKEPLLSAYEMINVHPSLLPRWRGAAPVERAIMAGDEETGVSIMRVTEGLDSGAVCLRSAEPIRARRRLRLARRRGSSGSAATCSCARSTSGRATSSRTRRGVTYADKIEAADRVLDPARPPPSSSARSARCGRTSARASRCPAATSSA